ncbi:hypothetical protein BGX38DRAFT_280804 [Terfezia claveryi]|nr:hypothetical protein BGX38DRAFT_280804 [Terfezia claveryi]
MQELLCNEVSSIESRESRGGFSSPRDMHFGKSPHSLPPSCVNGSFPAWNHALFHYLYKLRLDVVYISGIWVPGIGVGGLGEEIGNRAACIHVLDLVSHGVRGFPFLGVDLLVPIWSSRGKYIWCIDDRASPYLGVISSPLHPTNQSNPPLQSAIISQGMEVSIFASVQFGCMAHR